MKRYLSLLSSAPRTHSQSSVSGDIERTHLPQATRRQGWDVDPRQSKVDVCACPPSPTREPGSNRSYCIFGIYSLVSTYHPLWGASPLPKTTSLLPLLPTQNGSSFCLAGSPPLLPNRTSQGGSLLASHHLLHVPTSHPTHWLRK